MVAADAEGALARAEDLDLAGRVGLDPEHGLGLAHVAKQGTEEERRACASRSRTPWSSFRPVESELQEVGRSIHAACPAERANPLRALDQRAMELASQDAELRAALFRFVDVTPGLPLARRPRAPPDRLPRGGGRAPAADRGGDADVRHARPGRAALGAAAAAGVRHMAHRFIVGETPARRAQADPPPLGARRRGVARPARRGDRHRRPRRTATPRAAWTRSRRSPRRRPPGRSGRCSRRTRSGRSPRVNLSVKVSALTPLLRPEAPEVGREDAARRMRPLLAARAASSARTCTSTWSRWTRSRPRSGSCSSCSTSPSCATGPSAGVVIQAYLRESPEQLERVLDWARCDARASRRSWCGW